MLLGRKTTIPGIANVSKEWMGMDCAYDTAYDTARVGDVVNANDLHPWAECSNKKQVADGNCNFNHLQLSSCIVISK